MLKTCLPQKLTQYVGFKEIHCKPQRKTRCQLRNVSRNQRNLESWMILFASRKCSSRLVCLGWGEKHRPLVRCISCRMPCSQNAKHSHHWYFFRERNSWEPCLQSDCKVFLQLQRTFFCASLVLTAGFLQSIPPLKKEKKTFRKVSLNCKNEKKARGKTWRGMLPPFSGPSTKMTTRWLP